MKQFYIIANPKYFKKTMGWDMKHNEVKYTEDKLVMFAANDNVPDTNIIEPYICGWRDTDVDAEAGWKKLLEYYADVNFDNVTVR